MYGLTTPRRPTPPDPVPAVFLPPKDPSPAPAWVLLDVDDDTPLDSLKGYPLECTAEVCEACQ